MKRTLFFIALLCLPLMPRAERVSPQVAGEVAARVLQQRVQPAALPQGLDEMYLYVGSEGFVIVAADDCVRPVLAYGHAVWPADELPAQIYDWLSDYNDEIVQRRQQKVEASEATRAEWTELLADTPSPSPLYSVVVSPMIATTWNQSPYYNTLCPYDNAGGYRCVTGCVATATAQVMKYWNHPVQGTGSHSYVDGSHGTLSANFGTTTYQWSQMPNALTGGSSSSQVDAVATLMYHLGVAMEMSYGSSSGASTGSYGSLTSACAENSLKTYFGYSHHIRHLVKAALNDSVWCALIDQELMASRPIIYSGRDADGGHSFVLDGSDNAGHYHFNWGWGGYCDGYYIMGQLNPSPGGIGGSYSSTYNLKNGALMGVRPAPSSPSVSCPVSVTLTDNSHGHATGGGSHSYGDTVSIKVNTDNGYRFSRWSDGSVFNPRAIVLDSALSLTAVVEPINGSDTVYYAGSYQATSYGSPSSGGFHWGMRLSAADLLSFNSLAAVQLYDDDAGTYQLRVYAGGNSTPGSLVYQESVTLTGSGTWVTVALDTALAVDHSKPYWVTFYSNDVSYPAASSYYAGNGSGSWCSGNDGTNWHILSSNYSFMVRAIFVSAPVYTVSVAATHGTVAGTGSYTEGTSVMLTPNPDVCYRFAGWNDGSYANPRYVTVDSDVNLVAYFEPDTLVSNQVVHACDSYSWHGDVYTESTIDSLSLTSVLGCDSLNVLHLTMGHSVDVEVYDTVSGSLVWNNGYYDQSGDYFYVGQTADGCDSTVTLHLVVLPSQGIADADVQSLRLYPNPVGSVLTVSGLSKAACSHLDLCLYDLEGREFTLGRSQLEVAGDDMRLDLSQLPAGVYLLVVGDAVFRIVKQ